ncbi:O-antigen ligase family protein [Candidatus Enterovibrio escicola]|uniref:Membrane protein SypL involved in exopolysaccharide production n=1 Tax=Candidatus Enterovibrio escicola TaxID=1927127 RepID=A0A2A5T0D2_9GAMM|nr:O-antigen ligase family protein [Candidatus Enterovibrio escacola]PCS21590.1 Membrane protein SypL involved in exopolysaccharide production [Candidatus Enterovibrio escacola]
MQRIEWLAEQRQLLLTRLSTHFVQVFALFVLSMCIVWVIIPHPLIPIAIGLIPIAILIINSQPVLLGLAFIAFSFFRLHEAFSFLYPLKIPLMLSLGTLISLGWHIWIGGKIKIFIGKELICFYVFFVLVTLGLAFSGNMSEASTYYKQVYIKIGIMTPVLAWILYNTNHYRKALSMISLSGLAVALVTINNKFMNIGIVEETRVTVGRELGSVLGDPNDLALVLLFPFSFSLSIAMTDGLTKKRRVFGLVTAIAILIAIIGTQSRGGLLGILSALSAIAWRRVKSKVLLFSLGGVLCGVLFLVAGISERHSGGASEAGLDQSAKGRLYAWEAAFLMAVENPITGVGLNNFYFNYFYYTPNWDGVNHAVHSTWFGVLSETGFIGLATFLTMTLVIYLSAHKTVNTVFKPSPVYSSEIRALSVGLYSGIIAFCVSGTFLTHGFTWPLYILLALTASVSNYVNNKEIEFR